MITDDCVSRNSSTNEYTMHTVEMKDQEEHQRHVRIPLLSDRKEKRYPIVDSLSLIVSVIDNNEESDETRNENSQQIPNSSPTTNTTHDMKWKKRMDREIHS